MKSHKECPPPPVGDISFTTGRPIPPDPPPMRVGDGDQAGAFGADLAILIIGTLLVGIALGWRMHGGF